MDRSTSFRENMENPILSSLPSMTRSTSTVTQGDVTNFLQCLRFDPKSMAAEYKFNRHGDFKRLASSALGAPDDLSKGKLLSSSPEDLKRLRAGLRESTIKARERVKIFSESLSVVNKCFPSIPSRKRSRPYAYSGDRANGLLTDRAVMGPGVSKTGTQNHVPTSAFDFDQQKVEERGKNIVPSKRTRTSLADQRADVHPNTPARSSVIVDRNKQVSRPLQGEDRAFPVVADGWEKAKMKKKRSVIKPDATSSPISTSSKPIDRYREPKQGIHPRHLTDSYGFRPGAANGVVGAGKADETSPQSSIGIRSSIPKPEQDRINSSEKERTNIRPVNKAGVREELVSGSPITTKMHKIARGPRSGSGVVRKLSPEVQQATACIDRKRTLSARSSSPPVAQWADRRPQKISRTARRTNLVPVVSSNDEIPALDSPRHLPSGSEESGASEFRSRDKGKKSDDVADPPGQNVQKMSTLVLPTRKNVEDRVNGVRRQGRTGRGMASARFAAPMPVEKIGNMATAKQLRTARLSFDKPESKPGRPPTRKLSDRRAYTRQKHAVVNVTDDFLVGSDDGHKELLAAESVVINPSHVLSSPFWRQIETFFGFLSDTDISYLKQQGSIQSTVTTTKPASLDVELNPKPLLPGIPSPGDIPLCQRLLASLISENENDDPTCRENDDLKFNIYGSAFELETNLESKVFNHRSLEHNAFSNYGLSSTLRSCNKLVSDNHITSILDSDLLSDPAMTSEYDYANMSMNEKLLLEIQSIGLYPELVPDLAQTGDEDISGDICDMEEKHHEISFRKKSLLDKLLKSSTDAKDIQEKAFGQHSLDNLTGMAYQKYMSCWGPNAPGGKGANGKLAKQAALSFVKRTLKRCQEFETTGKSRFTMFASGSSHLNDAQGVSITEVESDQLFGKDEIWSSRVKKRELYLDDVATGKWSERDKEWKNEGFNRKTKTKLKQKTTQLSASVNGPLGKISDQHKPTLSSVPKENNEHNPLEIEEPLDFSHLQIPEMDVLGVGDDFGEQGQDIGSWLNIEDDGLQDDDFMGLVIPMDDLSDLNMMV